MNTPWDQRRSNEIRKEYMTEDVVRWTRARRRFWNEHIFRMQNYRLEYIAKFIINMFSTLGTVKFIVE